MKCFEVGVPVVSGTTGWLDRIGEIKEKCEKEGKTFFYASNFSIGVNIFLRHEQVSGENHEQLPLLRR